MSDKLQVKEYSDFDISDEFEGSFEEVQSMIKSYQSFGWMGIEFDRYGYDGGKDLRLYKFREETDEEYQKRLEEVERTRITAEKEREERRIQYERLKKEFENE